MSGQNREQLADSLSAGERVGDGELGLDRVMVAAAHALPRDVAGVRELADDAVRGALGADRLGDLHERRALQAQARPDGERWVDERGSAAAEAVALPRPDTMC